MFKYVLNCIKIYVKAKNFNQNTSFTFYSNYDTLCGPKFFGLDWNIAVKLKLSKRQIGPFSLKGKGQICLANIDNQTIKDKAETEPQNKVQTHQPLPNHTKYFISY